MRKFIALVLDDQPSEIRLLESILNKDGFDIIKCGTQEEAEQKLNKYFPHLLVVDINLSPESNGLDWLETVRQGPFKELPTIVMSGVQDPVQVKRAISLGIHDYILKPSDVKVLSGKLVKLAQKIEMQPIYMKKFLEPKFSTLESDAMVMAISEQGLAVSSHLQAKDISFEVEVKTDLYEKIDVTVPKSFSLLTSNSEANRTSLGVPLRSFLQTKSWSDQEKAKIRGWIQNEKLRRLL